MDLESLLTDLESSFDAERRADLSAQAVELAQAEQASVSLAQRMRGVMGRTVHLTTRSGAAVDGVLLQVREDFVLVQEQAQAQALVPLAAVVAVWPLGGVALEPQARDRRTSLAAALREMARRRVTVRLVLLGGEVVGRPVRVGADHLDLVVGSAASLGGGAGGRVSVALAALDVVRSR